MNQQTHTIDTTAAATATATTVPGPVPFPLPVPVSVPLSLCVPSSPLSLAKVWGSSGDGAERELSYIESFDNLSILEVTYRTEMCSSFFLFGVCEYGYSCMFAHALQQLRPRAFDPNYKTQPCANYPNCNFTSRCKFVHDEYRVAADECAGEYWLVSPAERVIRVEIVRPQDKQRKLFLQKLVRQDSQRRQADAASLCCPPFDCCRFS